MHTCHHTILSPSPPNHPCPLCTYFFFSSAAGMGIVSVRVEWWVVAKGWCTSCAGHASKKKEGGGVGKSMLDGDRLEQAIRQLLPAARHITDSLPALSACPGLVAFTPAGTEHQNCRSFVFFVSRMWMTTIMHRPPHHSHRASPTLGPCYFALLFWDVEYCESQKKEGGIRIIFRVKF